jgi:hypothetical protein
MSLSKTQQAIVDHLTQHGGIVDPAGRAHVVLANAINYGGPANGVIANLVILRNRRMLHFGRLRAAACYYVGLEPVPPLPDHKAARAIERAELLAAAEHRIDERAARHERAAAEKQKRIRGARRPAKPITDGLVAALLRGDIESRVMKELRERGLTAGEVLDLRCDVAIDEPLAERSYAGEGIASAGGRRAATKLFLHGFDSSAIAKLLDLHLDAVDISVRGSRLTPAHQQIISAHFRGLSASEISVAVGVDGTHVRRTLARAGVQSNKEFNRMDSSVRNRIVSLRQKGGTYETIRKDTGATTDQIRTTLRLAAKKGQLPGYGQQ